MKKKILALLLVLSMMIAVIPIGASAEGTFGTLFTYSGSLDGTPQENIVAVAEAQRDKTTEKLGYSEGWCVEFIYDCAYYAGLTNVIPKVRNAQDLYNGILNLGGKEINLSEAQPGDIVTINNRGWEFNHAALVIAVDQSRITTIEGNLLNDSRCYYDNNGELVEVYDVRSGSYSVSNGYGSGWGTITHVLRPAYENAGAGGTYTPSVTSVPSSVGSLANGQVYTIALHANNNLVLNADGSENLSNVSLQSANGSSAQQWRAEDQGDGTYKLINCASGRVLDGNGSSTLSAQANIQIYDSNSCRTENWYLTSAATGGWRMISGTNSNVCIDCNATAATLAAGVNIWTYSITTEAGAESTQTFDFLAVSSGSASSSAASSSDSGRTVEDGVYQIASSVDTAYGLSVYGNKNKDGANIHLWTLSGTNTYEQFTFTYQGDGYYTIKNNGSGKLLDVKGGTAKSGTNVQQYKANSSDAQLWRVEMNSDGTVTLHSKLDDGLCLDLDNGNAKKRQNIRIWEENDTSAQNFNLIPV